jgi:predicted permease
MGVISMLVVAFLPVSNVIKYAIVFLLSMPSAAATVLFSVQFGGDGEQATSNLLLSTILSLITIPLIYVVFQNLFGIPPIIA